MTNVIDRLEAYMDGEPLTATHRGIYITGIEHTPAQADTRTAALANRHGETLISRRMREASVELSFLINAGSIAERQEICQKVARWAQGSILQTSDRRGQQLRCVCTELPKIEEIMNRAEVIHARFTAYELPFWEEKYPSVLSLSGSSQEGNLFVPGNTGESFVEVTVTPASGTVNTITLTVGETMIRFMNLGATAANPLRICYDDHMIQKITVGSASALNKRTAASDDDLLAVCGKINTFGYVADGNVNVTFTARGLWL